MKKLSFVLLSVFLVSALMGCQEKYTSDDLQEIQDKVLDDVKEISDENGERRGMVLSSNVDKQKVILDIDESLEDKLEPLKEKYGDVLLIRLLTEDELPTTD